MPILIQKTVIRRALAVASLLVLSACTTGQIVNNPNDLYSSIYTSPPGSTLNQSLDAFSNGALL